MKFPEYVSFVLDRLEDGGFNAYLVGGCVRDFLMGINPHDFDITTNATPDEIEKCFTDIKTLDIGKKHGTITIVFDDELVEVTTYRVDGEYKDSRHPESVTFTDRIEDDLSRRDFTMNAIAYSPKHGFVDPFSGKSDIENKIIRCVGEPHARFEEDALRIMRALRFSSRLGFEIEDKTSKAIIDKKELLLNIAMERINSEFCGILQGKNAGFVIGGFVQVFWTILPELGSVDYDDIDFAKEYGLVTKLCLFFSHFTDKTELTEIMKRMKFDNKTVKSVTDIVPLLYTDCYDFMDNGIKHIVSKIGAENAKILYQAEYCHYKDRKWKYALERLEDFILNNECMTVKQLDVKGNEISAIGVASSDVGNILNKLLYDVIENNINNKKHDLLNRAKQYTDRY